MPPAYEILLLNTAIPQIQAAQAGDTYVVPRDIAFSAALVAYGNAVFNENGADVDFRVEGDTDANLLFVDASTDRVGIGTNAPGSKLHVSTSGAGVQDIAWINNSQSVGVGVGSRLVFTGTTNNNGLAAIDGVFAGATTADGGYMVLSTRAATSGTLTERARITNTGEFQWKPDGTTQAMTLDASGRLLVGLTADTAAGGYFGIIQAQGSYPAIVLKGTETSAKTWQIGENAGSLAFYNTTDGERARITSGGNFLVGTDNAAENAGLGMKVLNTGGTVALVSAASDSSQQGFEMYSTGAAAYRLYVNYAGTINATNTTISAISDQRLKENIQDLDVGLNAVMALKPRKFDWKAGKGKDIKGDRGWIAQEFEQVFPDMIDTWRDPAPEGEEPYKAVRADLIPVLVKAIQELKAEVDSLKAQLEAK